MLFSRNTSRGNFLRPTDHPQPPNQRPNAVDVQDITAGWTAGNDVFSGFSLSVSSLGLTLLSGSNGSGKSTLVELLSGYLRPRLGTVEIAGMEASSSYARGQRRICRTRSALISRMTTQDHLTFAARCGNFSVGPAIERAQAYGLGEWLQSEAGSLSTGNARKLWIIMCTLGQPTVVVLDEPYSGLDQHGTEALDADVATWAETGAVVLVAHALHPGLVPDHIVDLDQHRISRWGHPQHALDPNGLSAEVPPHAVGGRDCCG